MHTLTIEPWSEVAFAPFGHAIKHKGTAALEDQSVFDHTAKALTPYYRNYCMDRWAYPMVCSAADIVRWSAEIFGLGD